MSLIEQLGGYYQSKETLDMMNSCGVNSVGSFYGLISKVDLEKALLEYRRENGIIVLGDIILLDETEDELITVCERHKEMYYNLGFRHATNDEIKAGKRLP